ncbi:mammalian cell entry protein [Mycolicibacterium neoaurum]|uniref:mammalian cell entry protein n=1 Tax=Mycolicibacterium neoaurum TaxID=1795 RepID=UPI001BCF90C0|nr:mammalian cell entry protein [Mycolicibacterium neoaurum]QVI27303.1 mammalian cell entry protein [Mycolicibacterium neoaurum]
MGIDVASTRTMTETEQPDTENSETLVDFDGSDTGEASVQQGPGRRSFWLPVALGVVIVAALVSVATWQGYRFYQNQQVVRHSEQFLQAARQGALNLTTIDWQQAEADVQRIMDGAAGEFYDDFAQRAQPFVEVVKQAQSVSVGTVTEAALESQTGSEARALVAVSVKTSSTAGEETVPRAWRMRISVQQSEDQTKVSRVEFVP